MSLAWMTWKNWAALLIPAILSNSRELQEVESNATGSAMRGNLRKAWEEESRGDDGHSLAPAVKLDQEADALVAAGL